MDQQVFPYANLIMAALVFFIGVLIHWIGQIISLANWDFAVKIGICSKNTTEEFKTYEKGIAAADAILGILYIITVVGLVWNLPWAYKLLWFPGVIFIYHGLSFWFWVGNQVKLGKATASPSLRSGWTLSNLISGILAVIMAWVA